MRVLLTHELFPPDYAGGGEYLVLHTARLLKSKGIDVGVLTTGDPAIREFEGIPTRRLPIHRYGMNLAVGQIRNMAERADIIHTHNYHACLPSFLAGRWAKRPVVCEVLGLFGDAWLDMKGPALGRMWRSWEKSLVRLKYDRMLFLSQHSLEMGTRLGADPANSRLIPQGVASDEFKAASEKRNEVLFVGKLEVRKGLFELLAAAGQLPDVNFRVVGWGGMTAEIQRICSTNVQLLEYSSGPLLQEAMARASVLALPSRAEGFPAAILQAMASGCAIISTVPFEYEGVRVFPGDVPGIVRAIRELTANPERTACLGKLNAQRAQHYSWDAYAANLIAVYEDVLIQGKQSART